MRISKPICLLQIGVQFFYSSLCVYSFSFEAIADTHPPHGAAQSAAVPGSATHGGVSAAIPAQTPQDNTAAEVAGMATQAGGMLQNDALKNTLVSGATGKAAQSVEAWLNQFGTARVKVSADENFSLQDAELDVLLPIFDDKKENLIFTQLGSRRADDRNIINTGVGYRHFSPKWMWGANTFYDRQISENHHQRLGVGGELGWDYLKISANGYMRLSDWMASSRYEDYDERAANGFDIRTEGYLPAWPQLGASIMYEQYYGDNVDLFNDDTNRQKDPYAVTVGLNYTPFTLVTAGISQKMGKGDTQDTQFNLSFSYSPSVGMDKQLDPAQVALRRSLLGSRQDLVNRNNTIVLDYRKQDVISLGLPDKIEGAESATLPISATVNSKYGLDRIDWQADSLTRHGGKITHDAHSGQYSITLPDYQYGGADNHYVVTGKAYDAKGNGSNSSEMNVYVSGFDASTWQATTTASPASLAADGVSTSTVTVNLTADDQQPVTGVAGQLTATVRLTPAATQSAAPATAAVQNPVISGFTEASPGVYTSTFTSGNVAGAADIVPVINGKTALSGTRILLQSLYVAPALSTLSASKASALANGADTVQLTANVTTPDGAPYKGVTVFWAANNAAAQLSGAQSVSDENGLATVTVSSLSVINTSVSARLNEGGTLTSDALSFGADAASAQVMSLSADKAQAVANSTDSVTLVANVLNAQSQPLSGEKVDWKVEQGTATLSASQGTTDEQGNAHITLASATAGDVIVSARAGTTEAKNTDTISFTADSASMTLSSLTLDKNQALANGTDAVTYTATVTDANGNKVQGAPVSWSGDSAAAQLSASTVNTDAQGQAQVRLTTTAAGSVVVSAQLPQGGAKAADAAAFIADAGTAKVTAVTADKTQALANGADVITLSTTVTDANGNPLNNADVNWVANPTTGTLSSSSTKTNAQGVTTIRLTSSSVTDYGVTASVNGTQAASPTLTFSADASTAHLTSLVADKTAAVVAGKDTVNLSATVLDTNSHPVQGATVTWSSDNGGGKFTPASGVTNAEGIATAQFSATRAQTTVITASMTGSSKAQSLEMIADNSTATFSNVTADKAQALANGVETVTWTATVKDANQNPINHMAVSWRSDNARITLSGGSTQTNASGVATVTATSTKVADAVMTASLTTPARSMSAGKVSYIADASTATLSAVTVDKTQALANGADLITLSTTVTDAKGNVLSNMDVNWSVNPASGLLSAPATKTNAQGVATVTLASASVSQDIVTAAVNGTRSASPSLSFTADASTAHLSSLAADKTASVVAGKDTVTLTATVVDANNHPVKDAAVNWSSDNGSGKFTPVSGVTNADGIATAQFTETKAQTTVITATTGGGSKTQAIEVIADGATASFSTAVVASKAQALANGSDAVTWTATVQDANQNPISNMAVKWSSDNASVTPASNSTLTNAGGVATVTATSTQVADAVMTAALTSPSRSSSAGKVSYIADASTARLSAVTADKAQALANGADLITLSTTMTDALGNPLSNADVNWSSAPTDGALSGSSSKTNAQGVATVTLSAMNVGDYKVTASANGNSAASPTLTFTADAATAQLTRLVADKSAAVVAGIDTVTLSATVLDANGHPVAGTAVSWSSDNGSGEFTPVSGVTNADGVATAQFTETKAQTTVVTASMTGSSKTQALDVIADNATASFTTLVASKAQALANGSDAVTWTATVQDANQNPINNMAVKWRSDNASVTPAGNSTLTNAGGVATVTATSTKTADAVMTATLTTPARSISASKVSYIADVSTAQLSAVTTDKTQALANGAELATLSTTVTDAQGNALPDVDVSWSEAPATGTLSAAATKTTAQGVASVTLSSLTVGNETVTAAINGKTADAPAIAFIADAATAQVTTLTADKTAAVVAGIDTVTLQATVLDASGHPVANTPVTWSSDNTAGIFTPASGTTDANGTVSATLTSTLAQNTTVTASAGGSQKTLPVELIADANTAQVTIAADKAQAVANGTDAVTWTATVKDANANPVNTASVDWTGDNANVTLAGVNSQTTAAGTATMTGTSLKAGAEIVTATLTQQQRAASASAVTYIADVSTAEIALKVDRPTVSSNGDDTATFTATVKDAQGNLVTNATINWATTRNTLAGSTSLTNGSGVATMTLSGTEEGDTTVTASIGESSQSANTTFVSLINAEWEITGSSGKYQTPYYEEYSALGFIAVAPTTGPTSLIGIGNENENSPLTTPMEDEQGNTVVVNFGGQRATTCKTRTFNTTLGCGGGPDVKAILNYSSADNPGLPAGVYHGTVYFAGQSWGSSKVSFNYAVTVSLTVH